VLDSSWMAWREVKVGSDLQRRLARMAVSCEVASRLEPKFA
jgi:hypothetical protein